MEDSPGITSFVLILNCVTLLIIMIFVSTSLKIIPENKRLQVYRLGKYIGEKGPGIVLLIPIIDKGVIIDILDQMAKAKIQMDNYGVIGETITPVHSDGKVLINGETINALSKDPIPAGQRIRIVKVIVEIETII